MTVLSLGFASAGSAQSLATFGSVEAAGLGEGSVLIGTSMSTGNPGWGPEGTLVAQTYRYRSGASTTAQAYALSPSIGLQNNMTGGAISASLGYTFVHTDVTLPAGFQPIGLETGSRNGAFVSAQGNYWGTGENSAQVIGSYGFGSEYYWTRFRASHRLAPSETPLYLGGEVVLQGTQNQYTGCVTNCAAWRYEVGPTLEYRVSPDFRVGGSGGYRGGNNSAAGTGYLRLEFLLLTKLNAM